ncbi:MAG: phosphoribosylformylglycinamidine synthase I [Candidatus Diapherotrites archaeon]|nr:phosphoribosylformylglycinamidine synthase I [Candidatus Diapherotrites archaeon]
MKAKVLILTGYGINCDNETKYCFDKAGGNTERVHINDLISKRKKLEDYHVLAIPGGFSYADDIAAGKVLANKMRTNIHDQVTQFVNDNKLIIGICNGFQVLLKYPLLPEPRNETQTTTLTWNDCARFQDRWTHLKVNPNTKSVWFKGIDSLYLPIRHGEGKFVAPPNVLNELNENGQVVFTYTKEDGTPANQEFPYNPNGAMQDIAGICDKTGRICGIMPHPEAFNHYTNHPRWTSTKLPEEGAGLQVFKNAVNFVETNF